ncbi:hypothetical protein QNI19_29910 [Cytophagaceae bacterium DM2B3-1]|uniref:Prokaryotic RING finger family 4 n=1 Tax=Xanthocytophaga flava TaxID=3048013 RepID=A0ABT7CTX4_9BACT|nr:hypothetical protein [Xanthocytophaga flavus]MDJ1497192.1 hypothetical protein [Xanthocytophaga flavus]
MNPFITVSLRQKAIFIPNVENTTINKTLRGTTSVLVANLGKLGYGISEPLLHALNQTTPAFQANLLEKFREVMGVNKNWTPLVKGWDTPTGETATDHIITFFVNVFEGRGTTLPCGHIIPANTFPLERYNGCPFCGTPFEFGKIESYGQGSKLKMLELWTEKELKNFFKDLLTSKTALDATQIDSLKILLKELPLPEVSIGMKETLMTVIDICIEQNQPEKAQALFTSPTDILRYLWYKHTGFLQIIEPKTIIQRHKNNNRHSMPLLGNSAKAKLTAKDALKLKYSRKTSSMVAHWLNNLPMDAEKMCEMMHPKRGMWVRFIRALRLAEYSKRAGFEKLKEMMDLFYNKVYEVWQGRVNQFRLRMDQENTLKLLKQRPGLFARSLFANMLWFGSEPVVEAFAEVIDKVPARLVFTLNMYAENYFTKGFNRVVKPLGGISKNIPANALLPLYNDDQLDEMKSAVADLCLVAMEKRFAAQETKSKTIYIDPILFKMPVSIGDRSDNVQDLPSALMGTRFPIEGDTVRLFMQWGTGLPAQHMDMDLSCHIAFASRMEFCSYSSLVATGCKHSGDIRSIPNQIGTAEYIEINVNELRKAQAQYVTFTCNAYSNGSITPNLVIGWMNTRFPMKISEQTGVAYDPSCVQHQVRVTNSLAKGMVFGVLDVEAKEVIWLEMPFGGQVVQGLDTRNIESMLKKLDSKLSVGNLLSIKANAQNLQVLETPEADEVYTQQWAMNAAAVTQLLVD